MKRTKPYSEMTLDELREATKEFDREIHRFPPGRALSAAQKKLIQQAKRGRPKVGEGAANVQITLERRLLREADTLARTRGVTRSQLIAQGLQSMLRRAG